MLDDEHVAGVGEGAKRFPVVASVDAYSWRTSVTRMGGVSPPRGVPPWIDEAKRQASGTGGLAQALEMLRGGKTCS